MNDGRSILKYVVVVVAKSATKYCSKCSDKRCSLLSLAMLSFVIDSEVDLFNGKLVV
jgi:hypothetical protein